MLKQFEITAEKSFIGGWFIDTEICDKLIQHFENSEHKQLGNVAVNGDVVLRTEIKSSVEIAMNIADTVIQEYVSHLQKATNEYIKLYPECGHTCKWEISSANIQKYDPGGAYYTWHCERSTNKVPIGARHLVFMTYLNDVTDAGETAFLYQKLKVKPQKGLTLIWPVDWTHTHCGIPSPTQTKYIVTGWFVFIE